MSVGHSYPSRKVRLFHPVDTRELVTRLVVNFVPSGTGAGEGMRREGGSSVPFFFPSFFGLPVAVLFPPPFPFHSPARAIVPCFFSRSNPLLPPLSVTEKPKGDHPLKYHPLGRRIFFNKWNQRESSRLPPNGISRRNLVTRLLSSFRQIP